MECLRYSIAKAAAKADVLCGFSPSFDPMHEGPAGRTAQHGLRRDTYPAGIGSRIQPVSKCGAKLIILLEKLRRAVQRRGPRGTQEASSAEVRKL